MWAVRQPVITYKLTRDRLAICSLITCYFYLLSPFVFFRLTPNLLVSGFNNHQDDQDNSVNHRGKNNTSLTPQGTTTSSFIFPFHHSLSKVNMITDVITRVLAQHWPTILLSVLVGWLVRNRYHNGLNKYPGPFLASLTDWWRFIDVYKRRPEVTHIALHKKHGPIVRLGPNTLSFSDPEAIKTIYGLNKGFVKSDFYVVQQSTVKGHNLPSLFSTTDNDFHMQFRRCVNSAFAMSALVQYEPFVDNTTKLFLKQTERLYVEGGAKACNFTRWLQFYAFDVIGEITYSKRHGFIEHNEDIDGIVSYLTKLFNYVAPIGQIPLLDRLFLKNPLYLKLSQWGLIDGTMPVAAFARARMAERLPALQTEKAAILPTSEKPASLKVQTPDLLSKFLAARTARPNFMTDTLVQTMAVSMAFAGSETTAISLSAIFYYLLRTPRALARLRQEIDEAARAGKFSDYETGLVTWSEAQTLPYLDACVKEAFRLHPAPGLPMERIVPPQGAEIVPGEFVRGGTIVGVSAWVLHRNENIFGKGVEEYRPERWFVNDEMLRGMEGGEEEREKKVVEEEKRIKTMNRHMVQFGMGSRTCIGKNISLLEIYKLVPSLLRRFEVEFDDPRREWEIVNAWFVKQNNFITRFKVRELVKSEGKE